MSGNLNAKRCCSALLAVLVCAVAGCGGEQSEMHFVENTVAAKTVHRQGRKVVQKTVDEHFGTPLDSVAWLKLPVNYGKAEGTVKSATDKSVMVDFNPETSNIESLNSPEIARAGLLFTSGTNAGKSLLLASYDAKGKSFALLNATEAVPAAGDQFVVAGQILRHGRKLYARHCQHCHGVSGDGDGTTAKYLNPRPRDYRLGVFKFKSTKRDDRPTRDDLTRVIAQGVPGTYMPAFVPMLKDAELAALVEYVRWLAMRGQIERQLLVELNGYFPADRIRKEAKESGTGVSELEKQLAKQLQEYLQNETSEGFPATFNEIVDEIVQAWEAVDDPAAVVMPINAERQPVARVPDTAKSRQHGKELFLKDGKCINCHGPAGRGNGFQTEDFFKNDTFGATSEIYPERGLHDDWGQPIKPRDLTRGIYRGGRRPIDIYRRVSQGIKGTLMPAAPATLKPEDIWDLVNYVLSVPFESSSPKAEKPHGIAGHSAEQGHAN